MKICPKCEGTGKTEKPISLDRMGEVDCEMCEGTGQVEEDLNEEIVKRLDRIIELLEQKTGGKKQ